MNPFRASPPHRRLPAGPSASISAHKHYVDERFLHTTSQQRDLALAYLCSELCAADKTMVIYVWTVREVERVTKVLHKLGTQAATPPRTHLPLPKREVALASPVIVTTDEAASLTTTPPLPLPRVDYIINFDLLAGCWKNPPPAPAYTRRFADAVFAESGPRHGMPFEPLSKSRQGGILSPFFSFLLFSSFFFTGRY